MTISRRLRFEILRRDGHTCRYCGAAAPTVALTVDHVIPLALGGDDHPSNLVAACEDCNSGKSATPLDAATITDISDRARDWDASRRDAFAQWRAALAELEERRSAFLAAWQQWLDKQHNTIPLEPGWQDAVDFWMHRGFTIDDLTPMIAKAMRKQGLARGNDDRWRYFCGIVWRTLDEIDKTAAATHGRAPQPFDPNDDALYEPDSLYMRGYQTGFDDGRVYEELRLQPRLIAAALAELDRREEEAYLGRDEAGQRYGGPVPINEAMAHLVDEIAERWYPPKPQEP